MDTIFFNRLAQVITARDLQTPLGPSLRADMSMGEALAAIEKIRPEPFWPEPCVVVRDGKAIGWTDYMLIIDALDEPGTDEDEDTEQANSMANSKSVAEAMMTLTATRLITADTPALTVARVLADEPQERYFVLDGTDITGVLEYPALFDVPFAICIFSLIHQLESAVLELLAVDALAAWHSLPVSRRQAAIERLNRKSLRRFNTANRSITEDDVTNEYRARTLLLETMFIDKGKGLQKLGVKGMSGNQLISFFALAERVRNWCAHPAPDLGDGHVNSTILAPNEMREFIDVARRLISDARGRSGGARPQEVPVGDLW